MNKLTIKYINTNGYYVVRYLILILSFILSPVLYAASATLTSEQQQFIDMMLPKIQQVDKKILTIRKRIEDLYLTHYFEKTITNSDQAWLLDMSKLYGVEGFDENQLSSWQQLLARVDIIPPSMALAQAITESAWGTSRFATEGNNYYGLHCYSKGCGIVPLNRPENSEVEVKRYDSPQESIDDYIYNLNKSDAYTALREQRAELRKINRSLLGSKLIDDLVQYSEIGADYAKILEDIIRRYQLEQYDR